MRFLSLFAILFVALSVVAETNECSPKESASSGALVFDFSGTVHGGHTFQCDLSYGISFNLEADKDGWQIALRHAKLRPNFAYSVPHATDDSLHIPAVKASTVNGPLFERSFIASPGTATEKFLEHSPRSVLKVTDIKISSPNSENAVGPVDELSFSVQVQLPAVGDIPVFRFANSVKGSGVAWPKVISSPDPEYSAEARHRGVQGTVVLVGVVDTDGKFKNTRVERGLGFGLDEEARKGIQSWKFRPATFDGEPVPVQITLEMNFRL